MTASSLPPSSPISARLKPTHPLVLLVTWFGSGLVPKARGTSGTLAALPFAWIIQMQLGVEALLAASVIAFFIGWWASNRYMRLAHRYDDPGEIVIDEVAAMWLTIAAMPLMWLGPDEELVAQLYVAAFLAFRFFDILKPWPISVIDRRMKGGFGVMFDDTAAAILALLALGFLGHAASYFGWLHLEMQHPMPH